MSCPRGSVVDIGVVWSWGGTRVWGVLMYSHEMSRPTYATIRFQTATSPSLAYPRSLFPADTTPALH